MVSTFAHAFPGPTGEACDDQGLQCIFRDEQAVLPKHERCRTKSDPRIPSTLPLTACGPKREEVHCQEQKRSYPSPSSIWGTQSEPDNTYDEPPLTIPVTNDDPSRPPMTCLAGRRLDVTLPTLKELIAGIPPSSCSSSCSDSSTLPNLHSPGTNTSPTGDSFIHADPLGHRNNTHFWRHSPGTRARAEPQAQRGTAQPITSYPSRHNVDHHQNHQGHIQSQNRATTSDHDPTSVQRHSHHPYLPRKLDQLSRDVKAFGRALKGSQQSAAG